MQASQKSVMWSVGIVGLILLIAMLYGFSTINIPTASEIADEIDIEYPEFPEYEAIDYEKIDELWDEIYALRIKGLEDDSFVTSIEQFFEDNPWEGIYELPGEDLSTVEGIDIFFENIEDGDYDGDVKPIGVFFYEGDELFDFLEDEYEDIVSVQFIREYEDDREVNIINLSLDDEDDREIELSGVIKVRVIYEGGDETERVKVYISSVVTSDDGDLEAEITYSL